MLFNGKIEGFLGIFASNSAVDIFEKMSNTEQSYNVSGVRNIHASARSVFILERYDRLYVRVNQNDGFKDNKVHYGQQVKIRLNPLLIDKPIYLYSEPKSMNHYSKVFLL